jgi:hypothetical protein
MCHVHWHVSKKIFSVKESGHPVYYVPELTMEDVTFHVDPRLRAMFEAKPSRRTVHAVVKGRIVSRVAEAIAGRTVACNPFAFSGFRFEDDGLPAHRAQRLALRADRRLVASVDAT